MSAINFNLLRLFKGQQVEFEMQGDPNDEPEKRIRFTHSCKNTEACNWHAVQEQAAAILGEEFDYGDIVLAAKKGLSARIALEARLDTCPGGHGYAIAVQDGCAQCYRSLRFATPLEPEEGDYEDKLKAAHKRRHEFEDLYEESKRQKKEDPEA